MLNLVEMSHCIMSLPNKLAELVAEGGENFSAGQRQVGPLFKIYIFLNHVPNLCTYWLAGDMHIMCIDVCISYAQLLCIARVLLRKPKILVMDEATASIDNYTDELIQKMVRERFADSTVLTIAHRLHTVIDSDRILVLEAGTLAEFDSPSNLLKNSDGIFASLWKQHQLSRGVDQRDESGEQN